MDTEVEITSTSLASTSFNPIAENIYKFYESEKLTLKQAYEERIR